MKEELPSLRLPGVDERVRIGAIRRGDNTYGQTKFPSSATNVIAIAAGGYTSMALRKDGTVVTWGETNAPAALTNIIAIGAGD
ncbi:MAG TPA: RCC1 domain-containing protein, partial [Verrucomicrobiae bacterium]|nr:RCC1 domain-containing protein [Verrucomicrobiae bacterium]